MSKRWIKVASTIAVPVTALMQIPNAAATQDGIFTGDLSTVQGQTFQIEVSIQKGRIVQVRDLKAGDANSKSSRWYAMAAPKLIEQTLQAQSAKISGVSGASYTSVGWQKSLASALAKADFTTPATSPTPAKSSQPVTTPSPEASTTKLFTTIAGTNCPTVGKSIVVSDKKFTCTKVGKKLFWDKGKPVPITKTNQGKLNLDSDFKFMSDLLPTLKANGFDCTNYVKDPDPIIGAREGGNCTWNGQEIVITIFSASNSQVKELVNAFKALATGYIMLRSNWALSIGDAETAKTLSQLLNMEIL
jgi:uncharacterized protein with FMN-binding domain